VAKAARILIKHLDLLVDLVRRAGEDVAACHLILEGGIPRYAESAPFMTFTTTSGAW
jgi:hypothetical protein